MVRIASVSADRMTAEQQQLHDLVTLQRGDGSVTGPFAVFMQAPDIGERVTELVNYFMLDSRIAHNLKELAIIVIARKYTAQYEWFIHARNALRDGVDEAVIEAISERKEPVFGDPLEALVYEITTELLDRRELSEDRYARAVAALGEPAMVELCSLIGFYIMIAVFLTCFDVGIPAGATPLSD